MYVCLLTEQHEQVHSQLEANKNDVKNIQQALTTAEDELEQCEANLEECNRGSQRAETQA